MTDEGSSALKYRACARNVQYEMSFTVFTSWATGLLPDARSSALKYHACAQNVSDVINSFRILGGWPTPRCKVKCSQLPRLRT